MQGFADIHIHVVPGVDDGARSVEEAVAMIRREAEQGVATVIATPHSFACDYGPELVRQRFQDLRRAVEAAALPVSLYLGCEVAIWPDTAEDCARKLLRGVYPTMAGSRYAMIEFDPHWHSQADAELCAGKILEAGLIPIVAHAERYHFTTLEGARRLREMGAKIQINVYSVQSERKDWIRANARGLLTERLVDLIGTDSHRLDHRPPEIAADVAALEELVGPDYARQIGIEAPAAIVRAGQQER